MAEQARIARQLYREFLTLNRRLPAQEAKANLDQIKSKLSELRASSDEAKHSDALKELVAKTSFLRVMAPRRPGDHSITAARFIWRDGEIIEGEAERPDLRVASSQCSMAEYKERHHQLLKRQYFGKEPPAYDPSSF